MTEGKKSFVLYHDIREPLELLDDAERGRLFLALLDYSELGKVPKFKGGLQMAFAFIRSAIDRDTEAWAEKREKRAAAGRKGGQATQANQANARIAYQNEQSQANQAVPVPVPAPVPAPVNKDMCVDKPHKHTRFVPPSQSEVAAYCQERKNDVDAERFVNFYESKGWMIGPNKMKDWKAAVRTWEKDSKKEKPFEYEAGDKLWSL